MSALAGTNDEPATGNAGFQLADGAKRRPKPSKPKPAGKMPALPVAGVFFKTPLLPWSQPTCFQQNSDPKMARISHIAFGLAFVLLLAGCSRNAEQKQQASDSLYWAPPGAPEIIFAYSPDPLFLQLSVDPVVYISHISKEQELTDDEETDGVAVMPSTLDDILPRIVAFQVAQETAGKPVVVMIGGDDRAPCSSILKAIDCAKRARIEHILFETGTGWPSGRAFRVRTSFPPQYFEFPGGFRPSRELAKGIATITIPKSGVIQWEDMSVTPEGLVVEMEEFKRKIGSDKVLLVVRVDADAPFPVLRDVLWQVKRAGILKVMIAQR